MKSSRKPQGEFAFHLRQLGLTLLLAALLMQAAAASASRPVLNRASAVNSPAAAPVAVDDGGPGFTGDEETAFVTQSVLANDSDSDGDPLVVSAIDTSGTIGQVSRNDGVLDLSFDQDGKATTPFGTYFANARDLVIQPDGKILLAGDSLQPGTDFDFTIVRYDVDGSLDESFDGDGIVTTDLNGQDNGGALALQADQKILLAGVVGGAYENDLGIARYHPDGNLDLSFGGDGKIITADIIVHGVGGIAIQPDGKIVIAGTTYEPYIGQMILVARFNPDGSPDMTFDGDGSVKVAIGDISWGFDIALQPDEKIVVAGHGRDNMNFHGGIALARFLPDGSLDNSFSGDGKMLSEVGAVTYQTLGKAIALQPDQKIIVTGNTDDDFVLARYNPDGSLDTTFSEDGIVKVTTEDSILSFNLAIQPAGRIIAGGASNVTGYLSATRYQPDGSLDTTFGKAGVVAVDFKPYMGGVMALGGDGKIALGGDVEGSYVVARIFGEGGFHYDPNRRFEYLQPGEQAYDHFDYTASDGVLTDTATVTITVTGLGEHIYFPIMATPRAAISGEVTENGAPAGGIPVDLRFYDGANWSTRASAVTGSYGMFTFSNVPPLGPGQKYYVRYHNADNNPNRIWLWGTRELTSYTGNSYVFIGKFDLSNIALNAPAAGALVSLPYTFQWNPRMASLNDSYEFNLYDPDDLDPYFYTDPPLGYVSSYTLTALPQGFLAETYYVWEIWAYSPDGGYGISNEAWYVSFSNTGMSTMTSGRTSQVKPGTEIETRRRR